MLLTRRMAGGSTQGLPRAAMSSLTQGSRPVRPSRPFGDRHEQGEGYSAIQGASRDPSLMVLHPGENSRGPDGAG